MVNSEHVRQGPAGHLACFTSSMSTSSRDVRDSRDDSRGFTAVISESILALASDKTTVRLW